MILSHALLNPVFYRIQDPFSSICTEVELWLSKNEPEYLIKNWPSARYAYLQRMLGARNGAMLRGFSQRASNPELTVTLLDIYQMLDHSIYYTSKYWRAFYYYLKTGELNSECWPQFGQKEVDLAYSILTEEDIIKCRDKAIQEWADFYSDPKVLNDLFKRLKEPIKNLCKKRIVYFLYESAMSEEELEYHAYVAIMVAVRKNDYVPKKQDKIIGWALRCADNAIHNLWSSSNSFKKSCAMKKTKNSDVINSKLRVCSLSQYGGNPEQDSSIFDTIDLLGNDAFKIADEMEDNILIKELIAQADPKISSYLKVICCGEHNPDFWAWFYYNEPTLAQKLSYIEENPEALAPYLQRHLELPTYQLTNFLKEHLPDLLLKVDMPCNRDKIGERYGIRKSI